MPSFRLVVDAQTPAAARVLAGALAPDLAAPHQKRSTLRLARRGSRLFLHVSARDKAALRAAFHGYAAPLQLLEALLKKFPLTREAPQEEPPCPNPR